VHSALVAAKFSSSHVEWVSIARTLEERGLASPYKLKVQEQMEINLKDELDAVRLYNDTVKVCADAKDDDSKSLFESMIRDEERHADFLDAQLHAIKEMGIANYLAHQIGGGN